MIGKAGLIESDLFGISSRIKEIDDGYYIIRSYRKKRYEVHHKGQRGDSLSFVVPFPRLDCRTLDFARRTSRGRAECLFAELENENELRLKRVREAAVIDAERRTEEFLSKGANL